METGKKVRYLVADCESTGIRVFEDRIVQFFVGLSDEEGNLVSHKEWFINPGVPIPEEASEVHGLTLEWLQVNGQEPEEALAEIREYLMSWSRIPWILFNANYDLSILDSEFKRHGITDRFGDFVNTRASILDGIVIDRHKDRYRKGRRTLAAQADYYGVEYDPEKLHDAKTDVELTAKVTVKILEKFGTPTTEEQKEWQEAWRSNFESYLRKTDPTATVERGWPLREEE